LYDKIKGRSVFLMGTLSGITNGGSWDAIKVTVAEILTALTNDLNASKPAGVI
jgi:hypothetical protein